MKNERGLYFPDGDVKMIEYIDGEIAAGAPSFKGLPTFQFRKFAAVFPYIKNFRHYVDVGGHIALWARPLSYMFDRVTAFEPIPQFRECFEENYPSEHRDDLTLHDVALGSAEGTVQFRVKPHNSGTTHIKTDQEIGQAEARIVTLDSFELTEVDFLKIDVEGYELAVIQGGKDTIKRCRPTIIVEQKPGNPDRYGFPPLGAVDLLKSWGYEQCMEWSGDYGLKYLRKK